MKNRMTWKYNKFSSVLLLFFMQNVFAGNLNIVPLSNVPLPSTVKSGQTVVAYFTITNNSSRISQNGLQIQGLPTTAAQDTSAPNYYTNYPICGNPINLAPGASCLLQIDITGSILQGFSLCNQSSCTASNVKLNVSTSTSNFPSLALVTQDSVVPVQACSVNQDSGALENCHNAGGGPFFDTANVDPQGIQVGNNGSTVFMTTVNGSGGNAPYVYQCPVYANTGMFGTCSLTKITSPSGYAPYYGLLALNSQSTAVYLSDYYGGTGRVLYCPVTTNIIQPSCIDTGATNLGNGGGADPVGITLNAANNIGFVGSYNSWLTTCAVNGSSFSACGNKTGDGVITFSEAAGVAVNNKTSLLYIADNSTGDVYGCDISSLNTASTLFSSCFVATTTSPQPWGIVISSSNNMAYFTDYSSTVHSCSILENGQFSNCMANTGFSAPVDIALL